MTTEAEIRAAIRTGDLFRACDLADLALAQSPDDRLLQYLSVLALVRAGATDEALARRAKFDLKAERLDTPLDIDIAALEGRLLKDKALLAAAPERATLLREAAAAYAAVFEQSGDPFPGVNAATLTLLGGDPAAAAALAARVLAKLPAPADYWGFASVAEASAVRGDMAAAASALARAAGFEPDEGARASTLRQLRLLSDARGIDPAWLAPLRPRSVVHFTGHMIGARFAAGDVARVGGEIAALLERHNVGFGYGSLAGGADILFAEALIARGAELHIVLPFEQEEFRAVSVAPSGPGWSERFDRCLAAAKSISFATTDAYLDDDGLFAYCSRMAMGLARLRAGFLQGDAVQMVVWDGIAGNGVAGAAADVAGWKAGGGRTEVIAVPATAGPASTPVRKRRELHAMLFGDVKGFSKLTETELPRFVNVVLGGLNRALAAYEGKILSRNTWGDGVFLVVEDAATAAALALDLQARMKLIDPVRDQLPDHLALRLGGHVGPVFRMTDPIQARDNFFGVHVSKTARIEPVTPVGAVYVTEQFAADLAAVGNGDFQCDYVGVGPAAKGYGDMRFYSLRARG